MFNLLFVCTANQCRSPMAEAIARSELGRRGIPANVASAGLLAGGVPVARRAAKAVKALGLDLSNHVSRQIDTDTLADATLILTMERRHVVHIGSISLEAVGRTFALREFAQLSAFVGPRRVDLPMPDWIAEVDRLRDPSRALSYDRSEDVPDPMGRSQRAFARTADDIAGLVGEVLDRAYPGHGATVAG